MTKNLFVAQNSILFFFRVIDVKRACELLEKLQKSKYCGEVPATKLAALQKVLQSEFLNAVREVYEHVYETVDVQGNPEIRASATAKVRNCVNFSKYWLYISRSIGWKPGSNHQIGMVSKRHSVENSKKNS